MARGINKVILVGNLGNDPDVKYTQSGATVTTISVATTDAWTDKQGQKQERTEWHRVKFFGRLAEIAGEYLKKGRLVYIEGSLRTDKYTGKDGVERYTTEIIASEMQMLGGAPSERGAGNRQELGAPGARSGGSKAGGYGGSGAGNPDFDDGGLPEDDIPF